MSSLQFYQGQPGSLGIGEIILTGGTAHLPGLDAELGRLIGVRVRVGDPLGRVKLGKKVGEDDQSHVLVDDVGEELRPQVERAIRLCPRQAISWATDS